MVHSLVGQQEFVGQCVYKEYCYSTKGDVDVDVCVVGGYKKCKIRTPGRKML